MGSFKQGLGIVPLVDDKSTTGAFKSYCQRKGYAGITQECINEAKSSVRESVRKMAVNAENSKIWN